MLRPRTATRVLRRLYCQKAHATEPIPRSHDAKRSRPPPAAARPTTKLQAADHRAIGVQQELFTNSVYSPGSPIFLPHGAVIFNRLVEFLRKQYVYFGFDEVITPTIYRKALWAESGHLANYADDMFSVSAGGSAKSQKGERSEQEVQKQEHADPEAEELLENDDIEDGWGLKPMNCPGHCLIFKSKNRSYRDLPIRYADFSSLHRNEISGALTGLTRVRRFHQDDGHIFCRPSQVAGEIARTLDFIKVVYAVLKLPRYRFALSTRPVDHFLGEPGEWDRAESALRKVLERSGVPWSVSEGDGAFYGPKIDVVLEDEAGKEHQTATVQLDFQLPRRFGLEYSAPAPELEAHGEETADPELLVHYGPVTPVLVHRAVLGSVERLLALLIEESRGKWPFWLNPRQAIVLTVNASEGLVEYASAVRRELMGVDDAWYDAVIAGDGRSLPEAAGGRDGKPSLQPTGLMVDVDASATTLGNKIRLAHEKGYALIVVVGEKDAAAGRVTVNKESLTADSLKERMIRMRDTFQ